MFLLSLLATLAVMQYSDPDTSGSITKEQTTERTRSQLSVGSRDANDNRGCESYDSPTYYSPFPCGSGNTIGR